MSDIKEQFYGEIPNGVDIQANINETINYANTHNIIDSLNWFMQKVGNHGDWDYKQKGSQYEDFGNWHYGVVAKAFGFPDSVALSGAGGAQITAHTGGGLLAHIYWSGLDFIYGTAAFALGAYNYPSGGFGLFDDSHDTANIVVGMNAHKNTYGNVSNPLLNSLISDISNFAISYCEANPIDDIGSSVDLFSDLQNKMPIILVSKEKCTLCGDCVDRCFVQIFEIKDDEIKVKFDNVKNCVKCNLCVEHCSAEAISVF